MHGGATGVDGRDLLKDVKHARKAPGPAADGAPFAVPPLRVHAVGRDGRTEAGLPAFGMIRFEIPVVRRGRGVTAVDEGLEFPTARLASALRRVGLGRALERPLLGDPAHGDEDPGLLGGGVVAAEIESDEDRSGTLGPVGHVEEHVERGALLSDRPDPELRARGLAAEGVLGLLPDLDHGVGLQPGGVRRAAEHVLLDEAEDLRASDFVPGLRVGHPASVGADQRIGQRIRGHLGFLLHGGGNRGAKHQGQQHGGRMRSA